MLLLLALLAVSPVPAQSRQLLLSVGRDWDATAARVWRFERTAPETAWRRLDQPLEAALGRSGLAWGRGLHPLGLEGPAKQEGDGGSPAGVFDLRGALGEAAAPPGTRWPYRASTPALKCVDDPASRFYNLLVDETQVAKDWRSAEEMRRADGLYRRLVVVGHNDQPVAPGAGSCIFLHLSAGPGAATAGCTAFAAEAMEELLRWLDPAARPVLVQLPEAVLRARAESWGLPLP